MTLTGNKVQDTYQSLLYDNGSDGVQRNGGSAISGGGNSELLAYNADHTKILSSGKSVPTGDVVGTSDTQTLTNKRLNSPKINEDVVVTSTATELNILAGVTADKDEINLLDGASADGIEPNKAVIADSNDRIRGSVDLTELSRSPEPAYYFDGTNDGISQSNVTELENSSEMTFITKVKNTGSSDFRTIIAQLQSTTVAANAAWCVYASSTSNTIRFLVSNGSTTSQVNWSDFNWTTEWFIIAGTWDGSNLNLYVNGNLVDTQSTTVTGLNLSSNSLYIGRDSAGRYWNGNINYVAIYNTALTQPNIQGIANHGTPFKYAEANNTDLLSGWDFTSGWLTNGAGTTIDDADSYTTTGNGGVSKVNTLTPGKCYNVKIAGTTTATAVTIANTADGVPLEGSETLTGTFDALFTICSDDVTTFYLRNTGAGTTDITALELTLAGNVADFNSTGIGHNGWTGKVGGETVMATNDGATPFNLPPNHQDTDKTGNFTTDIASGTANKDISVPAGYEFESITVINSLSVGDLTNVQAVLDPAGDNVTLFSGKTVANGKTYTFKTLADHPVNSSAKTVRYNATGNGTGGMEIITKFRKANT